MASEYESLKVGDVMQVSNCTITDVDYEQEGDLVVKFDTSSYEYCLPASALTRIPPAQAEPVMNAGDAANKYSEQLDLIADLLQKHHPIGQVKAIGRMECLQAIKDLLESVHPKPTLTSVTNCPAGAVADITAALDREVEEVKEWVPKVGEQVLIEAEVTISDDQHAGIVIAGMNKGFVPTSTLRPLPVTQEAASNASKGDA